MLKKRIAITTIAFGLSLTLAPTLAQASTLTWMPGTGVLANLAQWWDRLPVVGHHAPAAPAARPDGMLMKNGCGIDPNGQPIPISSCGPGGGAGGGGTSGATAPGGDPGSGL